MGDGERAAARVLVKGGACTRVGAVEQLCFHGQGREGARAATHSR